MNKHEYYRSVAARAPGFRSLLAAEFNYDWDLDWPDVESVLVNDLDEVSRAENVQYRDELDYLLRELPDRQRRRRFLQVRGYGSLAAGRPRAVSAVVDARTP